MSGLGSKDRKKSGGGDGGPGWILTYGDMVTLLLAFFVMLFAVSSADAEKFDAFVSGLGMFGNPAANNIAQPASGAIMNGIPAVSPINPGPTGDGGTGDNPEELDTKKAFDDLRERVAEAIAKAELQDIVSVRGDPRGVAIVISTDDVLFARGSAVVTPDGEAIIAVLAPILRDFPNQIQVEGHADNIPLNRDGYTNWNLSTDRAVAVVEELAGVYDVAASRLTASGFGEFRPLDPRDTEEARSKNRRVEIVVMRTFDTIAGTDDADIEDLGQPVTEGEGEPDIGKDSAALPYFPGFPLRGQ